MKKITFKRSKSMENNLQTNFPKGLNFLSGEVFRVKHQATYVCPYSEEKNGNLYVTSYRLYFQAIGHTSALLQNLDVPLGTISMIKKSQTLSKGQKSYIIDISCKDVRKLCFEIENSLPSKTFLEILTYNTFPTHFDRKCFAFNYSEVFAEDGWKIYNPIAEFERLGIKMGDKNAKWRVTYFNRKYKLCETYPAILAVPGLKDNELISIANFRSKNRLPVLSWIHPKNLSTITRCSQPLSGVYGNRSFEDERYINVIRSTHSFNHQLTIVDARPLANAMVNKAKGGGYETSNAYGGIELIFCNIQNIHVMRESLRKLKAVCLAPPIPEKWFSSLENTMWLKHVKTVLTGAALIADRIKNDSSVVVHCSDGWDRTAQLTSLAMLLLDPYYRTIKGFEVLIEKEWLSFGHKFQQRYGHGDINHSDNDRSPIFIQFIDCVWQIQQQYPTAMEFNEHFLITILDNLYSCRFGTFMCDTEKEREIEVRHQTVSLWSWINSSLNLYKNKSYDRSQTHVLGPIITMYYIKLWKKYYCRWNKTSQQEKSVPTKPFEFPNMQLIRGLDKALKTFLSPFDVSSEACKSQSKMF